MAIADRIGVMNGGRLEQTGSAKDLYEKPASRFVSTFIGRCNVIEGRVTDRGQFEGADGRLFRIAESHHLGPAALCFRPECGHLSRESGAANSVPVTLRSVTYLGSSADYDVISDAGARFLVSMSARSPIVADAGERLTLGWRTEDSFVVT